MIRDLVKELRIFERNKVSEGIKILGVAIYSMSSFRRTAEYYLNCIPFHTML